MYKKLQIKAWLLLAAVLFAGAGSVWADTITSTFTNSQLGTSESSLTWTTTFSNLSFESNNNARGLQIGAAKGEGTITSSVLTGTNTVTKVEILASSNNGSANKLSVSFGGTAIGSQITLNNTNNKTYTFEGSVKAANGSIVLSIVDDNKSVWIKKITITYTKNESNQVEAPKFNPNGGMLEDATNVTITSDTEGASIYYTMDGSEPTTSSDLYVAPVLVDRTCTMKAIAVKEGMTNSIISEAKFTMNKAEAGEATIDFTNNDLGISGSYVQNATLTYSFKGLTFTFNVGEGTTNPRIDGAGYSSTPYARGYKNNTLIISCPELFNITKIEFSFNKGSLTDENETTYNSSNTEWTGNSKSVGFTFAESTFIESITVTLEKEAVTIAMSDAGYASFYYSDKAFELPAGLTATTYNSEVKVSKTYSEGDVIPAGQGYVLSGAAGEYTLYASNTTESVDANNRLTGSDEEATTTGGGVYYKLALHEGKAGFFWGAENGAAFTNGAHKAYLVLDEAVGSKSAFFFGDGTATAIEGIVSNQPTGKVYDLQGRKMSSEGNLPSGLYIMNGKKYVVK